MLKTLLSRVRQYKWRSIITPVIMVCEVFMEVLIPSLMALIIDNGVEKGDMGYVYGAALMIVGAAAIAFLLGTLSSRTASFAASGFASNLREDMYAKIQDLSFSDIDRFSTSSLITRMTKDVQNAQNVYMMSLRMLFKSPVMFVFAILMVIRNGQGLVNVFMIALPVMLLFIFIIIIFVRKYFARAFRSYDRFNQVVQENLAGIRTIKAYVREEEEEKKFSESAERIRVNFDHALKIMSAAQPSVMLVAYACMIAISYLGAKYINVGNMTTGQLMSIYTYTIQILMSMTVTSMIVVTFTNNWPSLKRIAEVLNYEPSMDLNEEKGMKEVKDGSVSFKHADFRYTEDGNPVLKDINLDIKSGETIGILGPTGSGKSTLISLIARLYDVTGGEVDVGGHNVKDYDVHALRNAVSVVLQKNTLFTGTVADNLRWGNENATEEEMIEALKASEAYSFISDNELGLNYHVEQKGANFSGGQRQRLCIARALMKKPRILIMDDSTSAVDTATDRSIRRSLSKTSGEMTRIVIAQRISSIEDADRIVLIENGRIADVGTHDELLVRDEAYRDLYETQSAKGGLDG